MFSPRRSRRAMLLVPVLALSALAAAPASAQMLAMSRPATVVRFASDLPADLEATPLVLRTPITLKLRRVTVERALQAVMDKSGISLTYSRSVVPLERQVSVSVQDEPVVEALRQILRGAGVELWVSTEGRMALIPEARQTSSEQQQTGTISGLVTSSSSGTPLPSVTVRVANSTQGAMTNNEGRYTIASVPAGEQVVIAQRIGFSRDSMRVTVPDGGTVTADFSLREVATTLATVAVNVGYGTTERRNVTGAIASVSADQLEAQPVQSVDQALLGRAAGVQVTSAGGQPGGSAAVRIRGGNSVSAGNDPLYVIDGVPVLANASSSNTGTLVTQGARGVSPLSAINPDDILSIDVLKDASATSIYGARAANGVVLITTKTGRRNGSTVTLSAYVGQQDVRKKLDLLDAREFAQLVNSAYTNSGSAAPYSASQIAAFGKGTDWQDAIFRTAPIQNYDLGFAGGDTNTRYFVSGSLLNQDGIVIGTDMVRGTFRLNLDQNISSKFRIGNRLTFSRSDGTVLINGGNGQETSSILLNALTAPPTIPVKDASGAYNTQFNFLTGRPFNNPVSTALEVTNNETQVRGIGNVFGEFNFMPNLTLRSTLGGDYLTSTQNFYSPSNTLPGRNYGGYGSRGQLQATTWQNENTLHYTQGFAGIHAIDLLGGITFERTNSVNVSGTAQTFSTDRLRENGLNNAGTFVGVYTGAPHSSLLSYFARANYALMDRYLLTVTGRRDGSSKFGLGNQYAFFPSAAFAWRASEEGFIKSMDIFDDLKVRTSYGRTGNQDIGNYASLATLSSTAYAFGGIRAIGYVPGTLANPNLKWETTDQFDVGVDAAVLGDRLSMTADYYRKHTKDLLFYVPVPATSGFGSSLQNIGSLQNRGFELGINTVNFTGPFTWNSALNLAWNRNKVLKLGAGNEIIEPTGVGAGANQNPTILRVGEPTNAFFGWVYDGKDASGMVQYKDVNGDGTITGEDRVILGNAQPNYVGGFTNDFGWNRWSLSVFLNFSVGNKIYNINRALLTNTAGTFNQLTDVLANGRGINTPKTGNTFDTNPSDLFVEDGTYLRGKNIRLSYDLPTSWLGRTRMSGLNSLRVYVSAQNFFTRTDYTGYDPELNEYSGDNLAQGFDFGTYPQPRQITFGFNAGF